VCVAIREEEVGACTSVCADLVKKVLFLSCWKKSHSSRGQQVDGRLWHIFFVDNRLRMVKKTFEMIWPNQLRLRTKRRYTCRPQQLDSFIRSKLPNHSQASDKIQSNIPGCIFFVQCFFVLITGKRPNSFGLASFLASL